MRIAMVSEHASPLAALGGVDAGGQNVYVARLSEELARRGHDVTVYTRRDSTDLPDRVPLPGGGVVEHVQAGPPEPVPKDELLPYMPGFGARLAAAWRHERPDLVHAHFWMSGMAARIGARPRGVPVVQTFHALGTVKRRHQGRRDTSPHERIGIERQIGRDCARVLATCTDEVYELADMGVPPQHVSVVPCGVDAEHFRPGRPGTGVPARRERHRLLACGRLVRRKGYDRAIRALTRIPDAELLLAGGPPAGLLEADDEAERLLLLAERLGVADRVRLLGAVEPPGCPPSWAAPTWCCAPPTTSRSASSRWRPWPAGCPSSPPTSAATATPSPTAPPAGSSRPATPRRSPRRCANSSPTNGCAAATAPRAATG